ncbi:MAG: tetratricopeptide repeat protein [Alphaproteobacteria bacterium]|nr:tetratricopeptide repeat protein [Alphaproteobacteria bacterium]
MSYETIFQQALKFHQNGQLDEAEKLYRQVLQIAPNNPQILNLLGIIAQSKNLHEQAVSYFEQSLLNDSNNFEVYFNLGWSLFELKKYAEAANAYHRVITLKPQTFQAYNALGKIYAIENKKLEAKSAFEHALTINPQYLEAQINLACLEQNLSQLQNLFQQNPSRGDIAYNIAKIYQQQNQLEPAKEYALQAAQLSPCEDFFLFCADILSQLQHPDEALKYYQQALNDNPDSVPALINIANSAQDASQTEQMYKKALSLSPKNFDAHLNYAVLLHKQNRLNEALEEYRQAAILNPNSAEVSNNLGLLQRSLNNLPQAIDLLLNAFCLSPQKQEYAANLAETLTLYSHSNPSEAAKIAAAWQKKSPDNPFAIQIDAALNNKNIAQNPAYSQQLFDIFADTYENTMQNIDYQLPKEIASLIDNSNDIIVDLGCGTGLLGEKIRDKCRQLIGVDISKKMLEKAAAKKIYDHLEQADIIEFCNQLPPSSLVIAADVIGYIGDLKPLIAKIFPHRFIFSAALDDKLSQNFSLTPQGRYIYNPTYINDTLKDCGYNDTSQHKTILRTENGTPVYGAIYIAKEKL